MSEAAVRRAFAIVGSVAVLAAIAGGLWAIGSPGAARARRFDATRSGALATLDRALRAHAKRHGELPPNLEALEGMGVPDRTDPETHAPYAYRRVAPDRFELCAEFRTAIDPSDTHPVVGTPRYGAHDAGRVCFTSTVDPDDPRESGVVPPRF